MEGFIVAAAVSFGVIFVAELGDKSQLMALTFATYAVPGPSRVQRAVAVAAVLALASLNYRGVTRTVLLTRVLVATSLTALAVVVVGIAAAAIFTHAAGG